MRHARKAITFVEIIVSAVILATAIAGIMATFISTRRIVTKGTERVAAANLIRERLDSLAQEVRADTWDDAAGALRNGASDSAIQNVDGVDYTVSYTASDPGAEYRRVTVTIDFEIPE